MMSVKMIGIGLCAAFLLLTARSNPPPVNTQPEVRPMAISAPVRSQVISLEITHIPEIELVDEFVPMETDASEEDIDNITKIVIAEAEGEPEEGKRLVVDSILNRVDHEDFPDTISEVIFQKHQYATSWGDRVMNCPTTDEVRALVVEELTQRSNYDAVFFRTKYYHSYGTPLFQVGSHYFSSY